MQVCTCAPVAAVVRVAGGVVASQLAPDTALLWGITSAELVPATACGACLRHAPSCTLKELGGEHFQRIAT